MELKTSLEGSHSPDQPTLPIIDTYFANALAIVSSPFILAIFIAVMMGSVELYAKLEHVCGEAVRTVLSLMFFWLCGLTALKGCVKFWDCLYRPSDTRHYMLLGLYRRIDKFFSKEANELLINHRDIQRADKEYRHQERVKKLQAWAERPLTK